jgi:hypothetical protein
MALSFPWVFPTEYLPPVSQMDARAEARYRVALAKPGADLRRLAYEYVEALVLTFGHQACIAAHERAISQTAVPEFVEEFERLATVHAYYHLGLRVHGGWSRYEFFRDAVIADLHHSAGWLKHLEERVAAMDGQATMTPPAAVDHDAAPALAAIAINVFRRVQGNQWEIQYEGRRTVLGDMNGFELIRTLLENPDQSIPAVRLADRDVAIRKSQARPPDPAVPPA